MSNPSRKQASRKATTLSRLANELFYRTNELRHNLPEEQENSEQALANYALEVAVHKLLDAATELQRAANNIGDMRTQAQVDSDAALARKEQIREDTIRQFGCSNG